jgi:hypothetical protein
MFRLVDVFGHLRKHTVCAPSRVPPQHHHTVVIVKLFDAAVGGARSTWSVEGVTRQDSIAPQGAKPKHSPEDDAEGEEMRIVKTHFFCVCEKQQRAAQLLLLQCVSTRARATRAASEGPGEGAGRPGRVVRGERRGSHGALGAGGQCWHPQPTRYGPSHHISFITVCVHTNTITTQYQIYYYTRTPRAACVIFLKGTSGRRTQGRRRG